MQLCYTNVCNVLLLPYFLDYKLLQGISRIGNRHEGEKNAYKSHWTINCFFGGKFLM